MAEQAGPVTVALVLASSTGGVGRHVRSLVAALVVRGHRVRVAGPAATDRLFGFAAAGAEMTAVEIGPSPRPAADLRAVARLRVALAGADVVHAHGVRAGLLAGLALGRATPYVVSWHNAPLGGWARRRLAGVLETVLARRATVQLAPSADLAPWIARRGGRDVRLVEVAAPPLPPPSRCPEEVRAELGAAQRPLILAVGRLHPQKGYDVLLEAAAGWGRRRLVPLTVVAGDGPLRGELVARAGPDVRLLGRRADVADLYAAADVVVIPSYWEARSLTAQEAARAGRPLVASAVGGLPELLGDAARLVAPGQPQALCEAVLRLLDDPAAAAVLGQRARERAQTWPTESDTARAVIAVYTDLLGRPL